MRRRKFGEGEWFALPLRDGGFAVGVVARADPHGILLGYFFGPRRPAVPELNELAELKAEHAVLVGLFGHLGLRNGQWPVLGKHPDWDRSAWPMPNFARVGATHAVKIMYDDHDPSVQIGSEPISLDEARGLPIDQLYGYGSVEIRLTALLA